jgi:hypothetical protein
MVETTCNDEMNIQPGNTSSYTSSLLTFTTHDFMLLQKLLIMPIKELKYYFGGVMVRDAES